MGFLDHAKEQASAVMSQGQAKNNDVQATKKASGLLEQLGAWQWAQQNGRDSGQAQEQTARILAELAAHEAEHGPIGAPMPPAVEVAPPPPGAEGAAPPPSPPAPTAPPAPMAPPPAGAAPPPPAASPPPVAAPPASPPPPAAAPPVVPEGGFTLD